MIRDARELPPGQAALECDICVIGGGAAGITLASELGKTRLRIVLLESGDLEFDQEVQDLYRGDMIGIDLTKPDIGRLRYFGGSTNHWNGLCRPLDPLDFQEREWIQDSGWPIQFDDLVPFYLRAQRYCQLGPFAYQAEDWIASDRPRLELASNRITMNHFQDSEPPTRFGEVYRSPLAASSNVVVWLNANCTEIVISEDEAQVEQVNVTCLTDTRFAVQATYYVLATGGIENARLLLLSARHSPAGVGNRNGLVGRFFSDHPILYPTATVLFSSSSDALRFFTNHKVGATTTRRFFGAAPATLRHERMPNCGIGITPVSADGVRSLVHLRDRLLGGEWPNDLVKHLSRMLADIDDVATAVYRRVMNEQLYHTIFWTELPPAAHSRVTLGRDRDALGQRRVVMDWQIPAEFEHTYARMHRMLAEDLGRSGLGRMQLLVSAEEARSKIQASHHHMGTTRMHADPARGVVDQHCRVHGAENLFIAGSSVFPAYGHANPTLTIVALATRLADHLMQKLGK